MSKSGLEKFLALPLVVFGLTIGGKAVNEVSYNNNKITLEQYQENNKGLNQVAGEAAIFAGIIGFGLYKENRKENYQKIK